LITLALFQHVLVVELHFLHILALLFVFHVGLILVLGRVFPVTRLPPPPVVPEDIDLRPWKYFPHVSVGVFAAMILTYVIFSPWGLVQGSVGKQMDYPYLIGGILFSTGMFAIPLWIYVRNRRSETEALRQQPDVAVGSRG